MPTYVYRFIDTGEIVEVQQAFTDEPFTTLPHPFDGADRPVKKVFTPVGVSFKGGGFYKTDSRSGSSSSSTPAVATATSTSNSSGNGDSSSNATSPGGSETNSATPSTPAASAPSGTAPSKAVTPSPKTGA